MTLENYYPDLPQKIYYAAKLDQIQSIEIYMDRRDIVQTYLRRKKYSDILRGTFRWFKLCYRT